LRVHPDNCGLHGLHRAHRAVSTTSWVMSGHGAWVVADPGPHPHTLPWSRSPHPGRSPVSKSFPKELPRHRRRLACGSSPLHRHLCRRPLPEALARSLRADPTRVDSRSVLVVLHHLDGLLRRQAPGLLHPGAGHGVHRIRSMGFGFRFSPSRSLRCASLRRFAPRRQPFRLSTVCLPSWRFEQHAVWTACPVLDGQRSLGWCSRTLRLRLRLWDVAAADHHVSVMDASSRTVLLHEGVTPRGPDLGGSSGSMRTGSAMDEGLPPSHRSAPASTP